MSTPPFADWLRDHTDPLTHLAPEAPLDDLEPLRAIVGDARVVSIGESSHFIDEFSAMRQRILRFLVERCGFTALAFEYGFSEGFPLDEWVQGAGGADDLSALLATAVPIGFEEPLRLLRNHNRAAVTPVRFAGIDVPAAGGSLLPALTPIADYLRDVDPEVMPVIETAMRIAESFGGQSAATAAPAWARLDSAERDALSAVLMRLLVGFRSAEPLYVSRGDQERYDIALQRLEGACHADYSFRAMADLFAGKGLSGDTARDVYMAQSVLWHLKHFGPGTRIVLAAHNAHIQKTPVSFGGQLTTMPMGLHLRRALGDDYVAIGMTSSTGQTADMIPDEDAHFGFTVKPTTLEQPEPGSIEAAFVDAEVEFGITDVAAAPRDGADRIHIQSAYLHTPIVEAFDAVLHTPTSTVTSDLKDL
ncbi:erythromycin esterase [Stackebrandtia endophytica]|uniref:Erythromycin esterase n=1 Tax=Stackebrandtia endophytica TaxID=1496996 RepID=A0A543APX4_9ACTN|nr:erythromycin esterase family protein [Stackebrandtia endophytica]TQL74595.1 erythromycin esterase [Stackebrandtia endophytica]